MSDFSFFFSFFTLLLGLAVGEILSRFANAIDAHPKRPIGWVTPLLAIFFLFDIAAFWLWTWTLRDEFVVSWEGVFLTLLVATAYFLSGALVFPREIHDWDSLDHHFRARKRHVLAGMLVANIVLIAVVSVMFGAPGLDDGWFYFYQGAYFVPLAVLWFSKSIRLDVGMLAFLIVQYQFPYLGIFPETRWGERSGINDTLDLSASTTGERHPK